MSEAPPLGPDDDRTVIRPSPGGRKLAAPGSDLPAKVIAEAVTYPIVNTPLAAAATPLLQLLAQLQNTARAPDAGDLHQRVVLAIRAFELRARQASVTSEIIRAAHYTLCAAIDDVVLNTPWGAASNWKTRTLVSSFHQNSYGGQQFFDVLARLRQDPERFLPVIEVMYFCLSLGFMGPYRPPHGDAGGFNHLRAEICGLIIAQRKVVDAELSPRWKGVQAPYRAMRRRVPVWVAAVAAMAAVGAFFVWVSTDLNAASDSVYTRFLRAPPEHIPRIARTALAQPPAPMAFEAGVLDHLTASLKAEIATGQVAVAGTASTPIVRVSERSLFPAGSASLIQAGRPLLDQIGSALKTEHGAVQVVSYTDNQQIHTVRFPSNFELSVSRAQAVGLVIGHALGDARRVTPEGRAEADPIASNETAAGREQNRRIEIVLHPGDQQDQ